MFSWKTDLVDIGFSSKIKLKNYANSVSQEADLFPRNVRVVAITKERTHLSKTNRSKLGEVETQRKQDAAQVRSPILRDLWRKRTRLLSCRLYSVTRISKATKSPSDFLALRHE